MKNQIFLKRNLIGPLIALCCFSMLCSSLCACSEETEGSVPASAESASSVTVTGAALSPNQDSDEIELIGKPLNPEQLVDFELDYEWARKYIDNWYVSDFLNGLDNPDFKDLYCKALTLVRLVSTDNLTPADAVLTQGEERAQLRFDGEYGFYVESGYTFDSFREAYYSIFTKETADIILSRYPVFYSYRGELWYAPASAGGNVGEVFQEYELINQTDTELEFKRISYSVAIGEPITEYDPTKKDEYEKTEVEFRFVKTADGWRAEKFLNATDYDRYMLIA